MVGLMSVCKLIFLILWSFGFLIFTSCVKAPAYEFDLHLYQVDESLLECPSGWHKFRNNCYFIVKEETTFQEADILCKRYGGYLVKIDGYNTNKGLGQLITNHNLSHVWIGLQRKQSGEFWWSNGQLAEVEDGFWANQSPILPSEYDLCTVMNLSTSNYGDNRWTLDHCDIRFSSICQTSACVAGQFRCSDGNGCISNSWICDGVYQCSDRSDEQLCSGSCGGHLQGILQTFHSPYYPQTYPKYSSCVWRLETPVGTRVKLKFESFMVEELYDKVIIYDGSSENDPLVGTYSGNTIPNVPYSSSNFILVIFQSDQDNQMSGFNATFLAVPKDECGSVLNASDLTQWLTSPNFPNSYPNNVICDWVIRSKNTEDLISFQFISLSLDTSDFVEIRQGESVDSPLYGRYTGEHIPPVFVATSHSLFVRLYTDNTKAAIGFNATFSIGCKNTIRNGYARIMSPGYGITKYPNSINCNWTIIDPEKRQLTLVFDQFDTEKDYDNVTVYLDNQTDYRHSGPVTPLPIRIDSDIFFITFNPDSQVNRKGWSLTVSYDCPSLNLTDHLKINSSTTTFGTYVLFSCDKGYQLSGTSVLICDIGGRWSASPPTCKVINCGSPALPDNMALVSLDTTRYLGNAVYRCNPGFVMTTGKVSICQSNGKWSLPYCTELNCPKLATSERLTFSSNTESHYVYGDIVTYNCDSNYRLIGASMTYCTANGTWSKSTPMCKAPMCPQIYILNGYTNTTEDISGGDYVFVTCNHGYTLIGSPVVHCGLNGMYTSLPSCQEVNECETGVCGEHTCQNLPGSYRCVCNHGYQNHPDNQTICTDVDECAQMRCNDICKNYDGGFQCKCVPGLHLYTEDTRVVKQKILWPNKTCIAKCPSFTVSNGGIIISDTYPLSTGEYIAPTTVSIHCPHGTIPDGSETVECHMGGAWNDTVTTCFNQQCQQLSAPSNGHVTYSNISRVYNSVATYSCDQGYELHGVKYRYCQSVNGSSQFEWTGIAPLCKEKMCPTLPDPTNGKAVYASTAIGSTMKYNCNCGYHLIGSQSRICQPEGLWDGRNAICAPSSVCQSPVTYSSIKLSKVLPFYAVGSEINYQCGKPGYEISETTALKCVIERPTRRPTFDLLFEMKFLTLASFNQSCVNVYVKEIVELFKLLVQNNCTRPRPSEKIIADVKNGNVLQVDLTIQLSKPEGGSISSVCQCRSKLLMIVNTGEIQKNLNNHTLNGSGDETCPVVRLKTVDNISITSNWTCGKGYEFVYSKDTCTTDLEPVCVKSTDCPDIYVSPTTISPLTTDPNVPISPINETTDDQTETTTLAIVSTKDHASMTTVSNETLATSDTITKDAIDDEETSYRRSTYEYISSSSEFSTDIKQKPSPTTVDVVNDTEVSVSENQIMTTEFTSAIMATSQKSTPVSVVMETTSVNQMIFNDTVSSTVIVQTTPKSITPHVTSEQQTFSPDVDSDTTIKSTTKILVTEEGTSQITAQKNVSDGSVMDTTAETMETGQTTQTAVEFTTENLMTVNATDLTIDHSDDTTESKNEDTTDLNITHTGRSTTSWENVTASNPEESTPKVTTVSKMSKVTTINSNTNTQPTPTIPDFFTVGDTSTTGSTKLTTHSINKTINVEATTQTVFSQSGFLTTNISTVSTQRGDQPEETSVSIQTDSQTEITSVPIQTDSQTEGTYVSTQTDSQTGRTSVSTQTDSQTGRTSVPTQTDSQTGRTYVSTQTDSQTGRTSVSTYTEDQPQTITTPQLTQTVNASQPTQVTSTSGSEVTSVSVSEVTSASVSGVTSTSFSEVTSTSVSEVSNTSVSEGSSASVSEVSSASVSESEVSSIMTHSVTSPPKTSTSKETEITLPTSVLPKYVIQIYSVLIPTELTEQCKTEINLYISSILNSTAGVSGTLQSSKLCSKYIIRVTIETTIKMKATSIEVTKTYGLSGQIQSILTPCGESIAEKLFSELKDSLTDLPSKTTCLQSLESSNIAINQWKCIDGYILDSSGEICNIVEQTTVLPVDVTTVSPHVTTISEHSRTTVTKNVTMVTTNPDTTSVTTTTAIVTEASTSHTTQTTTKPLSTTPTTTEPSSTTPTSTTTAMTTPGSTLPPTSLPFFLIQVAAVYTGTNLTSDGCINGMRSQIEEKVKAVSESIINGLKSWKQCSKQTDLVLLTKTGKISVVPDKLELTAPFAIQSSSGQVDTVTDCAIYGVQDHVNDKFNGLLSEVNPVVCYVTYAEFSIIFADWSCNDHYKYNRTSHICHLIQTTTTSSSASSTSLNGLEASDIKYFFPHGRLLLSVESFANVSMTDEAFCLSEYRNILASLLISQTVMINAGNLFDTNCPDIFISLYGIDVHPDDLNISVSKLIMTGDIAVKLFSMSASVTKDGLTVCLGYLASVFMTVNNHILIGQSTIPSSNHSHCSNVALSTVNFSNYFSDCTSGYVRALPGDVYYLCLRDNRTKYIVSLKMSYTWLPPTNKMCIDRLMSELSTSSLDYVKQYAANPEQPCTSDIVLQYTNVTASLLSTYTTGNITMIYELSSITETAAPLSGCSGVIIRNAETYFDEKLSGVFSSIAETCGSTPPQVVMSDVSGSYVCPDGKVWNQVTYQCLIPESTTDIVDRTFTSDLEMSTYSNDFTTLHIYQTTTELDEISLSSYTQHTTIEQIDVTPTTRLQYDTTPTATEESNLTQTTTEQFDTTPTSTEESNLTQTTTEQLDTTPTSTEESNLTQTTTEQLDTTPTSTEESNLAQTTTEQFDTTPTSTEESNLTQTTTEQFNTTPTSTEESNLTQTSTKQFDTAPTSTEESNLTQTTTEQLDTTPTSTEESNLTQTSSKQFDTTPTTTEESNLTQTTTEQLDTTPTSTEESNKTQATTEQFDTTPTSTEESNLTQTTTEQFNTTPTSTEESNLTQTSTKQFDTAPTTTEESNLTQTTTEQLDTTPTSTEESNLTQATTEQLDTTPTSTEESNFTQTTTEQLNTTPTSTEESNLTQTSSKQFDTAPTTTEESNLTQTTTEQLDTTPTSTEESNLTQTTTEQLDTTPTSTEESNLTQTTTEKLDTTPTSTEESNLTQTSSKQFDTAPTTTEESNLTQTTTEQLDTTPTSTEESNLTQTTTEQLDTTPTSTEESNLTQTTTEQLDTTPTSTEESNLTQTTTEQLDTTPTSTEDSNLTQTTTEQLDTTPTTTEESNLAQTTTEQLDTTPTSTEESNLAQTTTEQFDTTPTSTEESNLTQATTEQFDTTPTSTEESNLTQTTTEQLDMTPTSTEESNLTQTTTEQLDMTPTSTEESNLTQTTTEQLDMTPTSTEESNLTQTTTEQLDTTPTSTEESNLTQTTTEQLDMTPTSTEESNLTQTTTEQLDMTPTSTEESNLTQTTTEQLDTTPTSTEDSNLTQISTEQLDTTPTSTEDSNLTQISTEQFDTTSTMTENTTTLSQTPPENTNPDYTISVPSTLEETTLSDYNTTSLQHTHTTISSTLTHITATSVPSLPPICYICSSKKDDESCNDFTQLCAQDSSCQTVVLYHKKKALITKKCVETISCQLHQIFYPCDPTDYSTACGYCCSTNLCNADSIFLEWQDGRKKRKKRSAELVRRKRSNTVDTTAYWNSSFPTCIDIEPPVFHNCPSEDLTIYKEAWGPVFINISLPTAVDNSGISPRVTVIPADFRQPYLFRENTDVIFTAEDDTGNSAQCSIQVNLIDVYPLTITCPSEVVYIPYATINDTVFIRYNNTGVTTSSSTTHIQYHPPAGSLISINDHVNVMATAYDTTGNSTSCNFTYEATRDDQLPEYSIKVSYLPPNVNVDVNLTCSMKYGSELIWIFSNISVPQCDDYFMLVPDLLQKHGEQYLVMNVALGFKKMIVLDLDKMENCGNLSAQKMTELGNITLAPSGCNEITLLAVQEETTQEFLCPSNFTVLNKTSKFCTYCRKGTFSNMTSGACEICPITQETIPTECTVCSGRSSHCLDTCKPGEYSPTGLQPCTKCAVGTYTEISNATICRSCPSGKSTINTGTSSLTQCLAGCPIGQYSETGLVPCKPCPQMFYTDTTRSQFCTECSPGLVTTSTGSSSASQCIDPNVCDSDKVCLNGGSCVSVDSGRHFICQCSPGFRGKLCETYINECLSGPCVKGVCIDEEDSYSCICDQGYTGYNCDVTIDNCTPGECGNGTCVDGSHTCICYEGFTGNSTCEEKNECLPDPCEHGGVCIDLIDDFVCNCTGTGYTGKNCSILPQKCYNGSCLNDGVCHPHNLGYSCSCAQGYTGDLCQINIDDCTRHYCKNGAVCVDGINSHSCICQPGYSGSQCDVNTHCNDTPCVNKGSCVTTQTGFVCHCLAGYAGILCEVDIDECEHNKCNADKSTCKDGINGYTCECLPGWTGHTCSEHIGQCITSPCTDGSICTDLEDDQFSCTCMEGYTGHNCSVEINECRSSPCFNDGQCIDQVNGYTCTCKDSFTGTNCQHNIDMCLELPCQHNGTCLNLVDTFTCICEAGWTGQRCDTKVDNCLSLPCYNNATCLNIVNDFRCTCLPGYTGNQCQTDINECVSDPCLHDGQCKNVIGGYFCTCTSGYTGPNCNVINQPCPVCQNEATECHNGQCVCLPGYVGPDCGKERDYWYDLYFTPGGRVETEVTRMKNRNQLSLCLWLKVIDSTSSSPVLTLKAVDSDPKIDQEILKLNTDSLHLYYWGERTINFTILEGSWNHICLTWNSEENGQWFLYINGVVQIQGVGFGSGQELPIRQKIMLGPDTVNNNNKFHGIISQVNMYDSMLNATDIATGSGNCSISMPSGTVFRWQDFSSYVNSGAEVIEPSVCRSGGCPTGYSGQFCNSTKDTEPPTVEYCPAFVQVVTTSRLNIVNWTEPRFSDNVEIINIIQSHRSGQVFAYGEYDVMYIAYDRENNTAVCSFTVYVIPSNCTMPVPSSKVIMTCSNWSDGIYCTIRCKIPVMHKFVEEIPPFYKCGREGFWDPPRGEEFTFPTCAESSQPAGTIQGEMVFLGPLCTTSYREILSQNFVNSMNQWNMEFEMCPGNVCNFSNITVECVTSVRRRRRRSTKGTYLVIFDIPVNGSLVSEGDGGLPLTQLETMVKNEEFNTEDFSCDPASLVVKPYVTCQTGQILVNGLCVNCARGTYMNPSSGSCELCPRGQYTDHEKQVRCQSCDLGYTTEFPGASSSSHCYKSCKTGNYFDKSTLDCRPCEIGYYQDETGKMSCKSCGNGQTTQQTGSTSEVDCLSTCGAGTELSVLGICEPCVLGTYKPNDNQDSCQSCPYGYSTLHVGAISVHQCSVVSCPSDYFHNTAAQKCQVCPPAYHQPITGQNSCIPCNKFDIRPKCLSGEIDECALRQDNCDENADCIDTPKHFDCRCKFGYQGNGTICVYKCIGICNEEETCLIDNSGDPQCLDNSESLPVAALAGGASSLVLVMILIITVIVCKRRKRKKIKERRHNYQTIDRVHRELEVVTYPRRIPVTVAYKTNPAYSDSELSDPTFLGNPSIMWSMYSDPHEDLSKYCETSLRRPLRLRITAAMKNEQHFETISNKSWHDSSPGSSLDEYREDSHHSSPNSSISKYRADSNPKDSSPDSSIGQYKEDSLHKNDSPTSNKSDFSDSYF